MTARFAGGTGTRQDTGLTLVEVLVALAILSVIGVAGLAMLDTTLNVQRKTEDRLERLTEVDRALTVLRRDLATAAIGFVALDDSGLTFPRDTSGGQITISITLDDDTLTRQVQRQTETTEPAPQRLLPGVRAAHWRLLDMSRTWQTEWPDTISRPRAAELTLRLDLPGRDAPEELTRLFPMPAGAAP